MCSAHSITNPMGQFSSNRAPSWRTSGSASAAAALARSSQSRRCSPSTPSLLGSRTWEPPAPVRRWSHHHVRPVAVSSKGIQAPDRRPRPQPAPPAATPKAEAPAPASAAEADVLSAAKRARRRKHYSPRPRARRIRPSGSCQTEVVEALEAVKAIGYLLQATCLESLRQELRDSPASQQAHTTTGLQ